jgi:small subunit ribosomal protein S3
LLEDLKIRDHVKDKLGFAGIAAIDIERSAGRVRVRIFTARPGVIIGRRGQEIDKIKDSLAKLSSAELFVDIKEVKSPQTDAQLIAENIAMQLEKRIAFRRAMKKAIQVASAKGAQGIKVICKGRLGGAEIARQEKYHEGKLPLGTFRADVQYGFSEAHTTYGSIGVKVWVYHGDILVKKEEAAQKAEWEKRQRERDKAESRHHATEEAAEAVAAAIFAGTAEPKEPKRAERPQGDQAGKEPQAEQRPAGEETDKQNTGGEG